MFLYGDKIIKVDRDSSVVLPRGVPPPGIVVSAPVLHPTWQQITPSMSCASLLSVTWNELESDRSTLEWEVQWDFRVHGSSCGTCRDVLLRRDLRRQLHLLPVQVAGMCRSEKWELYLYGDMSIKVDRISEEVLPRGVPPLRFFTLLSNGSHHLWVVPAF